MSRGGEGRLPKFRILRPAEGGWEPYVDEDGDVRYRTGLDPHRSLQAAIQDAREFVEADPSLVLIVVDDAGVELARIEPVPACPF